MKKECVYVGGMHVTASHMMN